MSQKWATAATLTVWPISGLHCQLTPGNVFCVELTENHDWGCPGQWRCNLSSGYAEVKPGVILITNQEDGADLPQQAQTKKFDPLQFVAEN
ncbi:hypothetical protein K432DRAFT_411968 [Lepidopterella palustris CBS 459.81]|uniref:Uncharacterized protein n=1 Tax=Lepidopterella palustris CBS 459.81 TaxID=1314670 RepID=A0A8E2DVP6_9PEZI|nr:hypothetical protein K432DRAFT_411968 [Lepidopterella palustris CBS 459.81]